MGNLDAQLATDLASTFFREDHGWAKGALLGASGDLSVPLTTGTVVTGIFDLETFDPDGREGPAFWGRTADGYISGLFLTVTGEGTFIIDGVQKEDDGTVCRCVLTAQS